MAKHKAQHASHASIRQAKKPLGIAAAAIVVVILLLALVYIYQTTPTKISQTTTMPQTKIAQNALSVSTLIKRLSTTKMPINYTINYSGTIAANSSDLSQVLTGIVHYTYSTNGNLSRYDDIISFSTSPYSIESSLYYNSNGLITKCMQLNLTAFNCSYVKTNITQTEFGLSAFLVIYNYTSTIVSPSSNSSYNGLSCILINGSGSNTTVYNGIVITRASNFSACISPIYKVPLNMSILSSVAESGNLRSNGTVVSIVPYSQNTSVKIHEVKISNSSSRQYVLSLPTNSTLQGYGNATKSS